jgi:hypothetical protein
MQLSIFLYSVEQIAMCDDWLISWIDLDLFNESRLC